MAKSPQTEALATPHRPPPAGALEFVRSPAEDGPAHSPLHRLGNCVGSRPSRPYLPLTSQRTTDREDHKADRGGTCNPLDLGREPESPRSHLTPRFPVIMIIINNDTYYLHCAGEETEAQRDVICHILKQVRKEWRASQPDLKQSGAGVEANL